MVSSIIVANSLTAASVAHACIHCAHSHHIWHSAPLWFRIAFKVNMWIYLINILLLVSLFVPERWFYNHPKIERNHLTLVWALLLFNACFTVGIAVLLVLYN